MFTGFTRQKSKVTSRVFTRVKISDVSVWPLTARAHRRADRSQLIPCMFGHSPCLG